MGVTLPAKTIGNSGFEYVEHDSRPKGAGIGGRKERVRTVKIRNIKTGEILFTLRSVQTRYRNSPESHSKPTKKFLGLDDRYYYMVVTSCNVTWGQIQSDGAVLKSDRTILTTLAFFPHYKDPVTAVPSTAPVIVKEPPNIPKVVVIPPTPIIAPIPKEDISWIQKIINWIIAILNR